MPERALGKVHIIVVLSVDRRRCGTENKVCAFLSASAEQADREVVEWFLNLLKEYNIQPIFAADRPEPRPPQEKIREFIRESDIFVAVVTKRDKIEGKNLWKGPVWVQTEIGMAYTLQKPIAIFVEKSVQLEPSIAPFITDCISFDRRNLELIRKKAESFVEALLSEVRSKSQKQPSLIENSRVDETIVEGPEEGVFSTAVMGTGRRILLWRFGKLDTSLRNFYVFSTVVILILSYVGYDSLFGTKILGPTAGSASIAIAILFLLIVGMTWESRCKKCHSYFSVMGAPVTYGDIKKFPKLPKNKILVKRVCKVCGETSYHTTSREES